MGTNPASTAALDAPNAAPNLSATPSRRTKFSPDCIPLPPDTITLAEVSSGLSDLVSSSDMCSDSFLFSLLLMFSIGDES